MNFRSQPFEYIFFKSGGSLRKLCDLFTKDCLKKALESFHAQRKLMIEECNCLEQCEYVKYRVTAKPGGKT